MSYDVILEYTQESDFQPKIDRRKKNIQPGLEKQYSYIKKRAYSVIVCFFFTGRSIQLKMLFSSS